LTGHDGSPPTGLLEKTRFTIPPECNARGRLAESSRDSRKHLLPTQQTAHHEAFQRTIKLPSKGSFTKDSQKKWGEGEEKLVQTHKARNGKMKAETEQNIGKA
jgi:hypothetical protein